MFDTENFIDYIKRAKYAKELRLFMDIETYQYNEIAGKEKPTLYKNCTYSVAVSWFDFEEKGDVIQTCVFRNFKEFFDTFIDACKNTKNAQPSCKAKVNLIYHNNNKYDNHFLLRDLTYFYPDMKRENIYLSNAIDNSMTVKLRDLKTKEMKQSIILEKRIKSSNNLELVFFLKGIHFFTTDNFLKTHISIKALGEKLLKLDLIKEEQLKTEFNYTRFNIDHDMSDAQAYDYASWVFSQLNDDDFTYIENDVIILGKSVRHYSDLFPNFDYSKMTFTSNILESYNDNDITQFQLLNAIGKGKSRVKINYTDFRLHNENLYDFLKSFYRGGLNFYNYGYIEQFVKDCFSIDINSSYPFVMYNFKIPTFLSSYDEYENETEVPLIFNEEKYYLYRMTKETFNDDILLNIESNILKQMLVKYYTTNGYVNVNTYTMKIIREIGKVDIRKIKVLAVLEYDCIDFGSKDKIFEYYKIKTQGKLENKLIMYTPMSYKILDEINEDVLSIEEIDNAKVKLNGIYGVPALRAYFNLFRLNPDLSFESIPNGYKNTERNIVFSVFVTSVAVYNLLSPLKYLTHDEIDDYFIYCDTDSLYLKKKALPKLPKDLFDPIALGKWDIEHKNIETMFVLNHKKYALYDPDKYDPIKKVDKRLVVKCGGIDLNSFDTNMSFTEFIDTQFHGGINVKNQKSIYNSQGTISIYPSVTKLDRGKQYPYFFSSFIDDLRENILERYRSENKEGFDDALYIESDLGTFSTSDLYPVKHPIKDKSDLFILKAMNNKIKSQII